MSLWGALALAPAPSSSHLLLGLAVVAVALLVALVAAAPAALGPVADSRPGRAARDGHVRCPSRLSDPGAPGRPRPRAPAHAAAATL
ncbi:hypothetical protein [Mangrovihabitans endophyticus]|uniref:Uncharacterized protein n=1 Tax=Mangrovihabitans endophyticus TaxID=1751298 RepID=A0A8J3C7D2_9ACTN|nr:hypothetical protein [Mangrovihabitans endophyticus]GGL18427.1 hypothetical protein GCM10012284_61330 [Mangrovihabitans endophyticus]